MGFEKPGESEENQGSQNSQEQGESFEERMNRLAQEGSDEVAPVGTLERDRARAARLEDERAERFRRKVEMDRALSGVEDERLDMKKDRDGSDIGQAE